MNEKIDVMELAKKAGFYFHDAGYAPILHTQPHEYSEKCFERFATLVLERAALECEKVPDWKETRGYELAESILALKPVQREGKT